MASMVMYEKEFNEINECLNNLLAGSKSKCVFLVDKSGQLITSVGDTSKFDTVSLASLTAGNFAATNALAQIMGQNEFSLLFHQGEKDNIHISVVEARIILVVIFDDKTSLGLIRLRVKNAISTLSDIFKRIFDKVKKDRELLKNRQNVQSAAKPINQATQEPKQSIAEQNIQTKFDQTDNQKPVESESESKLETITTETPSLEQAPDTETAKKDISHFDEEFQKKAANEIDNLFMD